MQMEMHMQMQVEPIPGVGPTRRTTRPIRMYTITGPTVPLLISRQITIGTKRYLRLELILHPLLEEYPSVFMVMGRTGTGAPGSVRPGHQSSFSFKIPIQDTIGIHGHKITVLSLHRIFMPPSLRA